MTGPDYYRLLARILPAEELGGAVFRRLRRATVRRVSELLPSARPDRTLDVTTALHVSCLDDFAVRMRGDRAARAPIEPNERAEARRLLAKHLPGHAADVVARADRVLAGELFLFGAWRPHTRGELAPGVAAIDWTRDPLHGGHAPEGPSRAIEHDRPGLDARAIWEAARLAHVLWLAQAHVVGGLPGTEQSRGAKEPGLYARAAVLHVRDFLATQPVGRGIQWTCPMEAALRALHLSLALMLLRDAPELDALFWTEAAQALWQHGRFVDAALEDAQTVPGNHLLSDWAGLCAIGCLFPELPRALDWRERGLEGFSSELVRQTHPDGLSFESSLPYHRFVAELALCVQALARRQGLSLSPDALARLWRMCEVAEHATLPDGRLPNLGDNDSSRAFAFTLRAPLDAAHLPALRTALGGPGLAPTVEPESLWLGGIAGLSRNVRELVRARPRRARGWSASGLAVLVDGDRAATLWAGENGQHGLGGHAHNDKLSCEVVLRGRRLAVDPGCPVYLADMDERDRYRSTAAHPTVEVDRHEQGPVPEGRPFLLPEAARALLVRVSERVAWGEHRGYRRLRPAVVHRREVVLPAGLEAVSVTDRLLGEGAHVLDLRWPLAHRDLTLRAERRDERQVLEALEQLDGGEGRFDFMHVFALGPEGAPEALLAFAAEQPFEVTVAESTWSPAYGERVCGRTAHVRMRAELPASITSVFVALTPPAAKGGHHG